MLMVETVVLLDGERLLLPPELVDLQLTVVDVSLLIFLS